ncbi:MAG: phosphoribosyltransferase family protein [Acidobacteriota bacterium]
MSYERAAQNVARGFLRFIAPCPCLACGFEMENPRAAGLCDSCAALLRRPSGTPCTGCGRCLHGKVSSPARCGECRKSPPAWSCLFYAWVYEPPLDAVIMAMKFRRLDYLATRLGQELAVAIEKAGFLSTPPGPSPPDCVVPVPLHWTRRLTRGYDQADLIAGALADRIDLPRVRALRRTRRTSAQSLGDRAERSRNLRGAFSCRRSLEGRTVLLVDDVLTTGATLTAAARALRQGGAGRVLAATVARTPRPEETAPPPAAGPCSKNKSG